MVDLVEHETQLVLVETIHQYRMRYVVEVPVGKKEWAEDTVAMDEAKEFSQLSLGETLTSSRVISESEMLNLCDEDNEYHRAWSDERKREMFVTTDDTNFMEY